VSALWLVTLAGAALVGSVHCVGMCGGLIAVATDGARGAGQNLRVLAVYQAARLLSYATLGAASGALGQALDLAGRAAGLGRASAIVAGITLALWGLVAMLRAAGVPLRLPGQLALPRAVSHWLAGIAARPPQLRALLLGACSALLPCGFLYGFALTAAATGSTLRGALVMTALWLGSLPALLGFGMLLGGAVARFRRYVPLLSSAVLFGLGMLTVSSRVNLPAFALAQAAAVAKSPSAEPPPPPSGDCPCHRGHRP
jgi:uncharacterized protein